MVLGLVFYLFGVLCPLTASTQIAGGPQTTTQETTNTLDTLDKWFVKGTQGKERFFSDRNLGIRFRIPWKDYQTKTPRQLQALIEVHQGEQESPGRAPYGPAGSEGEGITYVLGIYPRSATRARPVSHDTSTALESPREQPYVPFLVVWYQPQPTLVDVAALGELTSPLKARWRFTRILQAMPWIFHLAETTNGLIPLTPLVPDKRLLKLTWQDSGKRAYVDLEPVKGLNRRVMMQAQRGRLLYFGLYYQQPSDRVLLYKVGKTLKIHPRNELAPNQEASWFSGVFRFLK